MSEKPKVDWFAFWVHFVFGALLGAFVGLYCFIHSSYKDSIAWTPMLIFIGSGALSGGVIAGCRREDFWEWLAEVGWWY